MKNILVLLAAISLLLGACGTKKVEYCNLNGYDIDCQYFDLYQKYAGLEGTINQSFDKNLYTTEEELALRKDIINLIDSKKDSLVEAFKLIEQDPAKIDGVREMRDSEIAIFQEKLAQQAATREELKTMSFTQMIIDDSSMYGEHKSVEFSLTNTNEKAIGNVFARITFTDDNGDVVQMEEVNFMPYGPDMTPPSEDNIIKTGTKAIFRSRFKSTSAANGSVQILKLFYEE